MKTSNGIEEETRLAEGEREEKEEVSRRKRKCVLARLLSVNE